MKHLRFPLMVIATLLSLPTFAWADCYADYKAKQDTPLRLHYGVLQLSGPCDLNSARAEAQQRLASHDWVLLTVISVFGSEGLLQRKADAGSFFLRY